MVIAWLLLAAACAGATQPEPGGTLLGAPEAPDMPAAPSERDDPDAPLADAAPPGEEPDADPAALADDLELELDEQPLSFPDPLEPLNRRTLRVNRAVDRWLLSPVARAYGAVVPEGAKRSVRRFFLNLESPAVFVNDLLQGEIDAAATTFARFSVNTVLGVGGLFDPATSLGLERHEADFGETLAKGGVGSGPYLIVPLLGPTTVRDGIGTLVDVALQPSIYLLGPAPLVTATVQEGTSGLTLREARSEDLARLEEGSVDYYAALRSAYYQDRMAALGEGGAEAVVLEPAEDDPS